MARIGRYLRAGVLVGEHIEPSEVGSNHNKAACALANKLARICYATLRDKEPFEDSQRLSKKINRESFVMPA